MRQFPILLLSSGLTGWRASKGWLNSKWTAVLNPETLEIQLHHFLDASQAGYGTVSYLRLEKDHQVHFAFLLGKARVAPLRQITIP